jgi:Protein of unknown function (DUF3631)/VirE N-terminal domain
MSEQILVSTVTSALSKETRDYDAGKLVEVIRTGGKDVRDQVRQLRWTLQRELATHGDQKRAKQATGEIKLPAVLWSGRFSERKNDALVQHSGLLCADLDSLNGSLSDVREKLSKSPHAWALFTSPSGDGLKAVFRVPADAAKHAGSFRSVEQHVKQLAGIQIDEACKDPARLCFVSYDPDAYYNPGAKELTPLLETERPKSVYRDGVLPPDIPQRERIASELLGSLSWSAEKGAYFCKCPGEVSHTNGTAEKHTILYLDNAPTIKCQHNSCSKSVGDYNELLRSRVGKAEYTPRHTASRNGNQNDSSEACGSARGIVGPAVQVQPRPLAELLDAVSGFVRRFVVFPLKEQADVIALWVAHVWMLRAFDHTAYLWVWAAAKRSGKSRVLEVLELICPHAELTQSGSSAALLRSIDENNPSTFLLDEIDAVFNKSKRNDSEGEDTRRFLNAGFRRGAKFMRCVGQGAAIEAKKFPAFCAKALAGIGQCLPDTVADRSIPIELERQSRDKKAERFRQREATAAVQGIRAELEAWSQLKQVEDLLRNARPELPDALNDRQQDICEPLFAIADLARGEWSGKARKALTKLCGQEEDADIGVRLLTAIKAVFDEKDTDRLQTKELLEALIVREDGPWALWFEDALKHGTLSQAGSKLAGKLKPYKIKPEQVRFGDDGAKGYLKSHFEKAWKLYLPDSAPVEETAETPKHNPGFARGSECFGYVSAEPDLPKRPEYEAGTEKCFGVSPVSAEPANPGSLLSVRAGGS